jgi:diguanylate cyclase (GGDEF)-like protein/PAS domain S-box-containing protein
MLLRGIRSHLLGLVLATVVPFTALVGVGLWSQWQHDQARAIEGAINEARLLAAQVDDHIGEVELFLSGLTRSVSTTVADTGASAAVLLDVKSELPAFFGNIALYSLEGTNIATSSTSGLEHPSVVDRKYFQQILAGQRLSIGDLIRSRATGEWIIDVARPVEDKTGRLLAVIVIGIRLEHFQDALRVRELPPGGLVTITNEKGIIIARNVDPPRWIGRDSSNWSNRPATSVREGSTVSRWQTDNLEHIVGFSTAHRAPWRVSVAWPRNVAFAMVASRLEWSALFVAVTLLIACAIAWLLSGRLVRPLRQLGKDVAMLAAGDLAHRTSICTQDEVGGLAAAFNGMAMALERREGELRKTKNTLAAVIDASPVAIVCSDTDHRTILWNRAAEQIFGFTAQEMIGERRVLVPPEMIAQADALFQRTLDGETVRDIEITRKRKDGTLVDVRIAAAPMYNLDGTVQGVARAYEDITERKTAEEQLRRSAHYDQLTGLPNRLSFQKQVGRLLDGQAHGTPCALAMFDLDGFKDVNDTLGHSTGDELLIEVGRRLESAREDSGAAEIYRLGGDEFVIVLPNCGDPLAIAALVDKVLKRLAKPFAVSDHVLHIAASAGIAVAPNDGACTEDLIANADLALYQAKSAGGNKSRLFVPAFRAQAQARRELSVELRRAFAQHEFTLYFQPQIRLADQAVVGAEALLRWQHPRRGIIAPGAFIDTLAKSVIAADVGRWIIRTAARQTAAWRAMGLPMARMGVNLFPSQAHDPALLNDVAQALKDFDLPAEVLELEITENAAFNFEDPSPPLQKLHELGVKLAFDDFGTGYASLTYLTRFPVSRIKIDRSFVGKITDNTNNATIVSSLIAMAHKLGLKVIAEGVETQAQAAFLLKECCEEAQGFLYSKPLAAEEFTLYLQSRCPAAAAQDQDGAQRDPQGNIWPAPSRAPGRRTLSRR